MSKAIARARIAVASPAVLVDLEMVRRVIVLGCAAALILAGRALPF